MNAAPVSNFVTRFCATIDSKVKLLKKNKIILLQMADCAVVLLDQYWYVMIKITKTVYVTLKKCILINLHLYSPRGKRIRKYKAMKATRINMKPLVPPKWGSMVKNKMCLIKLR